MAKVDPDTVKLVAIGRQISKDLAKLNMDTAWEALFREWRRPGWTTEPEFIFVSAILDSMSAQVKTLARLQSNLLKGSKAVTGH